MPWKKSLLRAFLFAHWGLLPLEYPVKIPMTRLRPEAEELHRLGNQRLLAIWWDTRFARLRWWASLCGGSSWWFHLAGEAWIRLRGLLARAGVVLRTLSSRVVTVFVPEKSAGVEHVVLPVPRHFPATGRKVTRKGVEDVPINAALAKKKSPTPVSEPILKARKEGRLPDLDILDKATVQALEDKEVRRNATASKRRWKDLGYLCGASRSTVADVTQYGVERVRSN